MGESVVDYQAWNKGYQPPGEHVLIDALSYRGARIILSTSFGDFTFWLVTKGEHKIRGKKALAILEMISNALVETEDQKEPGTVAEGAVE